MPTSPPSNAVVVGSLITWRALYQRPQQMVANWPTDDPIVFLEPITGSSGNALRPQPTDYGWRVSVPLLPYAAKSAPLRRLANTLGEFPIIRQFFDWLLRVYVATIWSLFDLPRPRLLLLELTQYEPIMDLWPQTPVAFDYMDDVMAFEGVPEHFRDSLNRVVSRADHVIATSRPLVDKLQPLRDRPVHCIGNGVDAEHFSRQAVGELPANLTALPGRRIVYAGSIAYWLDFDILRALASAFPDDSLVLLGPVQEAVAGRVAELTALPNVHAFGTIPYAELPAHLAACHVGLIPFVESELTRAVNPNKAYEYAALGLPFVSTALPPMAEFQGLCPLLRVSDDWCATVREELRLYEQPERLDEHRQALVAMGRANSWASKMQRLARICLGEGGAGDPDAS